MSDDGRSAVPLPARRDDDRLFALLSARRTTYAAAGRATTAGELATVLGWACGRSRRVRAYGREDHPLGIAPMPGGIDALRTWVAVREVDGLAAGLHRYDPDGHRLWPADADRASALLRAATQADLLATRDAVIALAVDPTDGVAKYGPQFLRNADVACGGVLQALHLTTTALGLQGGAFTGVDRAAASAAIGTLHEVVALFAVAGPAAGCARGPSGSARGPAPPGRRGRRP